MMDVREITRLARASTTSFDEAVDLIQAFADAAASQARIDVTRDTHARTMTVLNASLGSPLVRGDQRKHERVG